MMTEWSAPCDEGPDEFGFDFTLLDTDDTFDSMTEQQRYELFKRLKRKDTLILPADGNTTFFRWDGPDEHKPIIPPIVPGRRGMIGYTHD